MMSLRAAALALASLCVFDASRVLAHELDPAYLSLTETAPKTFSVVWKLSIPGGLPNVLEPVLPRACQLMGATRTSIVGEARLQTGQILCPDGLAGLTLEVSGLPYTMTDALVRVDYLDGTSFTGRLTAQSPAVILPAQPSTLDVVGTYVSLGIEHILLGVDHLLFVLALLLFVKGFRRLVVTVTAFTVAHSITLAAATLRYVHVPQAPVEATIALSILFLATELARREAYGRDDLAAQFPWLVAFTFGLLHGLGFAGALTQVGLPPRAIPLALLFFNVGVELGQLAFIAGVLALGWLWHRTPWTLPLGAPRAAAYGIGPLAAFWVFERTAAFW